ncbi:hypothetical protein RI367_007299 [Sorochytrium milnesiophthora]
MPAQGEVGSFRPRHVAKELLLRSKYLTAHFKDEIPEQFTSQVQQDTDSVVSGASHPRGLWLGTTKPERYNAEAGGVEVGSSSHQRTMLPQLSDAFHDSLDDRFGLGVDKCGPSPDIKNVLITGGAGFIASFIVRKFVRQYPEYNIYNLDKLDYCSSLNNQRALESYPNYHFIKARTPFHDGDITVLDLVSFVLHEKKIDTILHFAAQTHVDNSFGNSFDFTHNNVMGTHVLLEAAKLHHIKRFVHVSTDEVYGEVDMHSADLLEQSILAPTNPYSATKAAAEMLVEAYHKSFNLPAIITRSNNVYGPCQYPEKVIPKFILLLERGQQCFIHGSGSNTRRYIYATDVADAIDTIVHKGNTGEIYNIGSQHEISNLELAHTIVKAMDLPGDVSEHVVHVDDRAFNDRRYAVDCSKVEALGWKPRVTFEDGLKKTIEWYSEYGATWWGNIDHILVAHPLKAQSSATALLYKPDKEQAEE